MSSQRSVRKVHLVQITHPGMLERPSRAKSNLIMAFKSGQFLTQVCISSRCLVLQERTGPVLEKIVWMDGGLDWRHGGLGARIEGLFELRLGQKLKILVGQQGQVNLDFKENPGGGGGGTFVTLMDNSPLLIAGGGGGGSISIDGNLDGDPGQAGQNGTRNGGSSGSGGRKTNPGVLYGTRAVLWGDGEGMNGQARSFRSGGQSANTLGSLGGFGGGGYGLVLPGGEADTPVEEWKGLSK